MSKDEKLEPVPVGLAEGEVFPVSGVRLSIRPEDHPFAAAHRTAIAENWQQESAANPALFDGRMLLMSDLRLEGNVLVGEAHDTAYSAFLYWRRSPALQRGFHVFGFPVLLTADGALVAVEMSPHTANAGQVYCPAGSLEPADLVDGIVDVDANMRREVREETGITLSPHQADPQLYAFRLERRVTLFRVFRLEETADAVAAAIYRHMETDHEQEISRPVLVRKGDEQSYPFNASMRPLLNWLFS